MPGLIGFAVFTAVAIAVAVVENRPYMSDAVVEADIAWGLLGGTIAFAAAAVPVYMRNGEKHEKLLHEWNQKIMCRRCGSVFVPPPVRSSQRWR
jgi:hypothetical protein